MYEYNNNCFFHCSICIIISSLFFMSQIEKWFDAFFNEESKVFEKYAKDITEIVKKNL